MSRRAVRRYEAALAEQKGRPDSAKGFELKSGNVPNAEDAQNDAGESSDSSASVVETEVVNMFDMLAMGDDDDDAIVDDSDAEENPAGGAEAGNATVSSVVANLSGNGSADLEKETSGADGAGEKDNVALSNSTAKSESDTASRRKRKRKKRKGNGKGGDKGIDDDEDWYVGVAGGSSAASGATETRVSSSDHGVSPSGDGEKQDAVSAPPGGGNDEDVVKHPDGFDLIPGYLLAVNPNLLSTESEMKQLFGARVVEAGRASEELERTQTRRHGRARGYMLQNTGRSYFVTPRDTWWRDAPGLVVVKDATANEAFASNAGEGAASVGGSGVSFFRFVHERRYQRIQDDYEVLRQMHDPNSLVGIVNRFPYHVDSLLVLAEIYRQTGEIERAGEMVERALYVLESTWPRSFKPFNGKCRMSYNVLENRSLFHALFRHVQILSRRGLHRTALESAKLLYSLDPPLDPKGILLVMDSLALMCGQYEWVRRMHDDNDPGILKLFPNFSISAALAAHLLSTEASDGNQSGGRATGQDGSFDDVDNKAVDRMTEALLAFPMVLRPIMMAAADSGAGLALCDRYDLFNDDIGEEEDGDKILLRVARIYAQCSKGLWTGSVMGLLHQAAICAGSAAAGGRGNDGILLANAGREHRSEAAAFISMSGMYTNLIPSDFGESTTSIPAELLAALNAEAENDVGTDFAVEEGGVYDGEQAGEDPAFDVSEDSPHSQEATDAARSEVETEVPTGATWREAFSSLLESVTTWRSQGPEAEAQDAQDDVVGSRSGSDSEDDRGQ